MGKGSARRKEDTQKIRDNWDVIFSKKNKEKSEGQKDIKEEKEPETDESKKTK